VTTGTGRAAWQFALDPGNYRFRARFEGAGDLRPALSRTASVRIR
jgi:hypothetical protein